MKIFGLPLFILILLSCSSPQIEGVSVIDGAAFKAAISESNVNLIDVRTPDEFNAGTIDYAVNIDYKSDQFLEGFSSYNKNEALYIFCHSGGRSGRAASLLSKAGFTKIYDLKGGYSNWDGR